MKSLHVLFLSVLALALSQNTYAHKVVGIADGDTLTLLVNDKPLKIRLANIDAPEKKQPFGQKSKESLSEMCWGKDAQYEPQSIDRYKRMVALVTCGNVGVNREQVRRGMAWVYDKYNNDPFYGAIEAVARKRGLGLWEDAHAVPPWEWRKRNKRS
jgi:micrococcal nuclease